MCSNESPPKLKKKCIIRLVSELIIQSDLVDFIGCWWLVPWAAYGPSACCVGCWLSLISVGKCSGVKLLFTWFESGRVPNSKDNPHDTFIDPLLNGPRTTLFQPQSIGVHNKSHRNLLQFNIKLIISTVY